MVNTTPAAMDSPAEPVVWMMLFSRMVVPKKRLPKEIANTAMGMDADTVKPALSARYTVAAPKIIPNTAPKIMARIVNSLTLVTSAGIYGLNWSGLWFSMS